MLSAGAPMLAPPGPSAPTDWTPFIIIGMFLAGIAVGWAAGLNMRLVRNCTCLTCGCLIFRNCRESHHVCCRCGRRRPKEKDKSPDDPQPGHGEWPDFIPDWVHDAVGKSVTLTGRSHG